MNTQLPFATSANKKVSEADIQHTFVKPEKYRDPRFDKTHDFDASAFRASYKFIRGIRENENNDLKKQIKQMQNNADETQVNEEQKQKMIDKMNQNKRLINQQKKQQKNLQLKSYLKHQEQEAVKEGKQQYYMNEKKIDKAVQQINFVSNSKQQKRRQIVKQYEKKDKKGYIKK